MQGSYHLCALPFNIAFHRMQLDSLARKGQLLVVKEYIYKMQQHLQKRSVSG
jgi:hypothetical protein